MTNRMRQPTPSEEYITVIDNKGRRRVQRVQYIVSDVRQEEVYVTTDGLAYAEDSLARKAHYYLIDELDRIPDILAHPDIVIYDPVNLDDTLIYYKHLYIQPMHIHQLVAVVVKFRQGIKFFYNLHPQQSGKVKGYRGRIRPKVWHIAPDKKHQDFGI
jgi:hypothetical protein